MKVYIISGQSRGYIAENEWVVGVYTSSDKASALYDAIQSEAITRYRELKEVQQEHFVIAGCDVVQSKLDPQMCFNGGRAEYDLIEIELDTEE